MASTSSAQHSTAQLRALLRASALIAPELRAHWLRVLPHLSAEQRAELATLLDPDAAERPAPPTSGGTARAAPSRVDAHRP